MKNKYYIAGLVSALSILSSCVHLKPLPLDTAVDNDPYFAINNQKNNDYVDKFTTTDIFIDDMKNAWGFEKDACRDFYVSTDVKYEGEASLSLNWDKSKKGCDWIGVGIAWNNWQIVDMSNVIDSWALSFWIRTKEGKMPEVPLIFNFIDQSSKATDYVNVTNKYYSGQGIDTLWKHVIIPLSYFRFKSKGVSTSEITQLIVQFGGNGASSIYIDEFKFISLEVAKSVNKNQGAVFANKFTSTEIFTDELKNAWGFDNDACREFAVVQDVKKQGSSSLHMKWDKTQAGCDVIATGFAWNNWNAVNLSEIIDTWALRFYVRTKQGSTSSIPLSLNFIDDGNNSTENINITASYTNGTEFDEKWKEVTIPLKTFKFKEKGLNLYEIKQLVLILDGTADIYIDDMTLINQK